MEAITLAYRTRSLCPECLRRIDARHTAVGDRIFLEKVCPDHGPFRAKVWEGRESYEQWQRPKIPIRKRFGMTDIRKGCPFDCGLCPDHGQHTCTAVLDVTLRCNLSCRFCFADAANAITAPDPGLDTLIRLMEKVFEVSPGCNLQLSGGEPTLRDDLPGIVAEARNIGFAFVQLNTNGIRLAKDEGLARRLKGAGLDSVFLQFDGVTDETYAVLRGTPLLEIKSAAVENCVRNGIGVILVPTLVPGVNTGQIGDILRFGLAKAPGVRGVHFQPVSYFGRHRKDAAPADPYSGQPPDLPSSPPSGPPADKDRITIPEVLSAMEVQTRGMFRAADFKPSSCEHALCAFTGKFLVREGGAPKALTFFNTACCAPVPAEQGSRKATASVARHWKAPAAVRNTPSGEDGLTRFIRQAGQEMFTVSGMAFQDVWNLDLTRLQGCCIHAVAPDGRLIPFCAYNLTGASGKGLYRAG